MSRLTIPILLFAVVAAPAIAAESKADEAALAFLASLGTELDTRVLGEASLTFYQGGDIIGFMTYKVSPESTGGPPLYRLEMKLHMGVEKGPTNDLEAWSVITPDLRTLKSGSEELQVLGEKRLTRTTITELQGETVMVTRTVNDQTKEWRVPAQAGLIDSGGEPLLVALLAVRGVAEGKLVFVTRQQDQLFPLLVEPQGKASTEILAGRFDTLGYVFTTPRFDDQTGTVVAGKDGRPAMDVRGYSFTAGGVQVRWEIGGTPLHFEKAVPAPAPGSPVAVASAVLAAMAAKNEQALLDLLDWDALFAAWLTSPAAAEVRGQGDAAVADERARFPKNFVSGILTPITDQSAPSLRRMANPAFWCTEPQPDGAVVVRLVDLMAKQDPKLTGFVFRVRPGADGKHRVVRFPGL